MSDDADFAARINDAFQESALRRQRESQPVSPEATGACLNCGEPTPKGRRWCDAECRDQWEEDHG